MKHMKAIPTLPLVIEITNNSSDSYSCIEILSVSRFEKLGLKYGSNNDISVKVNNFDFSYEDLIKYLSENKLIVKETIFMSYTSSQNFELSQYRRLDDKINLIPTFQNIENSFYPFIRFNHKEMTLDKDSSFVIKNILANAKLTIYLK